jgi:HD-GYP domain-containing protein (c-di-GMP phosphodiesterase class II)
MNWEILQQNRENREERRGNSNEGEKDFKDLILENCFNQCHEIINKNKFIYESLAEIKDHDMGTFLHSLEVGNMTAFLVNKLGRRLNEEERRILMSSALLHDYGKTAIDASILNKKESLTSEEKRTIESHPVFSFNALRNWDADVAKVAVSHHEHQTNSYPRKRVIVDDEKSRARDKRINHLSKILAIVDSFQAMLDPTRPSNKGSFKSVDKIVNELSKIFVLNEEREIIFLLESYCYRKSGE